jgi:hypothetical protein
MQLDLYTSGGFLRRWRRTALGFAVCTFDAVDPTRISEADRAAIIAGHAQVQTDETAVLELEAARRLLSVDQPERYEDYTDEAGETRRRETQAYKAWKAAEKLAAEASTELHALADLRAGIYPIDAATGDPVVPVDEPGEDPIQMLPPPNADFTWKSDVFARCIDDAEAEAIEVGIAMQGAKLRNFFASVARIEHSHPIFPQLKAGFAAEFGQDRANELLAPSE